MLYTFWDLIPKDRFIIISTRLNEKPIKHIRKAIFVFCSFYPFFTFLKCCFLKWIFRYMCHWNIPLLLWILLASMLIILMSRARIRKNDIYLRKLGVFKIKQLNPCFWLWLTQVCTAPNSLGNLHLILPWEAHEHSRSQKWLAHLACLVNVCTRSVSTTLGSPWDLTPELIFLYHGVWQENWKLKTTPVAVSYLLRTLGEDVFLKTHFLWFGLTWHGFCSCTSVPLFFLFEVQETQLIAIL